MSDTLLYGVSAGVATITLNRPQVMNALDSEMIERLREVCEEARDDELVRVIVVRGNGPAFLAGGDVDRRPHRQALGPDRRRAADRMRHLCRRSGGCGQRNRARRGVHQGGRSA